MSTDRKKCERCGKELPVDTPSSVYGCTAGSGCADYSQRNETRCIEETPAMAKVLQEFEVAWWK